MVTAKEQVYYTEVYVILEYLGEEYINEIPKKLLDVIEKFRDKNSNFKLDKTKKLSEQVLCQETKDFLAFLNLLYWEKNQVVKDKLLNIYKKNDIIYEDKQKEKYSYENLFKNNKIEEDKIPINQYEEKTNTQLIEVKESFIIKIINKIKELFWRWKK